MSRQPCVYILASKRNGTLYVGATSRLAQRMLQHRNKTLDGFTRRYDVTILVHVEYFETMRDAIVRERRLKEWNRSWKLKLIEQSNPQWRDLYDDLNA